MILVVPVSVVFSICLLWWSDINPTSVGGILAFAFCGSDISPINVCRTNVRSCCDGVILVLPVYVVFQCLPTVVE